MIKDTMKYCPILGCVGWNVENLESSHIYKKRTSKKKNINRDLNK